MYFLLKYVFLSADYKFCFKGKQICKHGQEEYSFLFAYSLSWPNTAGKAFSVSTIRLEVHTFDFYIGFSVSLTRIKHCNTCIDAWRASR